MRAAALLLVVLAPVMQVSSNLVLITSRTGETASFTCDLTQGATYIHLYKYEEGTAPRRLLYYDSYNSKPVLESGISGEKYHVYKSTERRYAFAILNLKESDSGIYYCAIWDKHVGSDFLYTALEILLVAANHSLDISSFFTSSPISFNSERNAHESNFIFHGHPLPPHKSHSFS